MTDPAASAAPVWPLQKDYNTFYGNSGKMPAKPVFDSHDSMS
jgi:hypothetical protein